VRILSPKMVEAMTTDQTGTVYGQAGMGFGLGFWVVERFGAQGLASVGSFGWGGAYGSTYMVDPAERLIVLLMIQQLPNGSDVPAKFPTLVYQALVEPKLAGRPSAR
jgi:CubicO group peptidase (beta-lactamase class C family)